MQHSCKVDFVESRYECLSSESESARLLERAWTISLEVSKGKRNKRKLVPCYCLLRCEACNDAGECLDVLYVLAVPNSAQTLAGNRNNGYVETLEVLQSIAKNFPSSSCSHAAVLACRGSEQRSSRTSRTASMWLTWSAVRTCTTASLLWSCPLTNRPCFLACFSAS